MGQFNLEHLNAWLLYRQVRHFNIQAMEVDTVETLINCLGKLAFTDLVDSLLVVQGAELVELSEEVVELGESSRVLGVGRPEAT